MILFLRKCSEVWLCWVVARAIIMVSIALIRQAVKSVKRKLKKIRYGYDW